MALKPNILLINCDDMGYGDLGCYGPRQPQPACGRAGANGVLFTDFYAPLRCAAPAGAR